MKRTTIRCCILVAALLLPCFALASDPGGEEPTRVSRLFGLCKLWGHVKYFHPSLAYRSDIDWDAALIETIPKVREAKTSGEYEAALQSMLDVLSDPLTHIVQSPSLPRPITDNSKFESRLTEDGILIIKVGDYFELPDSATQEKLRAAIAEISKAHAIVFDLRSAQAVGEYGQYQLASIFAPIERLISTTTLSAPGDRRRVYYGFETYSSLFSFGQYKSGFFTQDGRRSRPTQNARDVNSIFILNKDSGVPGPTLALQASGKGLVILDGDSRNSPIGKTDTLDLGENLVAQIRISEPIYDDGTNGEVQPDIIVSRSQDNADKAMATALELARKFQPSRVVRKKLPGSGSPFRDRSYPEMKYPAIEYRLLAAFRIWSTINYFYPYKHLIGEDWDAVLREFIPRFEGARNALEYSLAVAEMVTHVHDSHAYLAGTVINEYLGTGYPSIRVRMIENAPVVTATFDESGARTAGIEVGDVILKVDGEDARARLARYAKYISASTPQSNMDKAAQYFMNGKEDSIVTLTVRNHANQEKEVRLKRKVEDFTSLYHRERSGDIIKLLSGNIGYVDLDRLTVNMVDEMFEKFKSTRAIIFDMRGYPNGTVWSITPRLTERSDVPAAFFETPLVGYNSTTKSSEAFYQLIPPAPPGKWTYKGKTVMLIDERTQSQAEHTGMFLKAANGTTFIGSHTAGANGEVTAFAVPGGITIGFTGQSVRFPDGKQLQRIGLVRDIEVKPTIKGIRAGRDEVLDEAVKYLMR